MVQGACAVACVEETLADRLLLLEGREWWSTHEVLLLQRVLLCRPAPGRFMYQAAEEAGAYFTSEFPDA